MYTIHSTSINSSIKTFENTKTKNTQKRWWLSWFLFTSKLRAPCQFLTKKADTVSLDKKKLLTAVRVSIKIWSIYYVLMALITDSFGFHNDDWYTPQLWRLRYLTTYNKHMKRKTYIRDTRYCFLEVSNTNIRIYDEHTYACTEWRFYTTIQQTYF